MLTHGSDTDFESISGLDVSVDDDVFTIEIGDLDANVHGGLEEAFRAAYDSDARVVVVTGQEETFLGPTEYDPEYFQTMKDHEIWNQVIREAEEILESCSM